MDGDEDDRKESTMEDRKEGNGMVGSAEEIVANYSCYTDDELQLLYLRVRMAQMIREGKKLLQDAG